MEPNKDSGFSDYFSSFRRRRWLMVGIALPILATTALLTLVLPTYYRSTAVFRFEAPAVEAQGGGADARNRYLDAYVSKLQDSVLGPASLVKLRDILQLPPEGDGDLGKMQKKIHVEITTERILDPDSARQKDVNSGFILYYESRLPQKAQQASQWLSDQFLNQGRQDRHDRAMQAATFLQAEADKYRVTISTLESKLADFKQQHVGELPDSAGVTQGEKERTEVDLSNIEQQLSALRQNRIFLQSQLQQSQAVNPDSDTLRQLQDDYNRKLSTYDANHPDMLALKRQIDTLQRGGGLVAGDSLQAQLETQKAILAQTRQRYSEDHPDVKRLERSIETLQARIASGEKSTQSTSVATNPVVVQLQTQINGNDSETASLMERRGRLNAKLASIASTMSASPQIEKQYEVMNRDVALARDKYDELLKRKMDSEVTAAGALAGSGDEFHLLLPPGEAVRSNKSKAALAVVGLLLAGILSLAAALGAESFDQTVRGSKDLVSLLDLAPLAVVPEIRNSRYLVMRKQRLFRVAVSALVGLPLLYGIIRFATG